MAIPILFRAIDLSVYPIIDLHDRQRPSHWPVFAQQILVLQWRFAKQIALRPSYASFVRTFNWTMGLEHHFDCCDRGITEAFDLTLIYSMFTHLTKTTHINIDTGSRLPKGIPRLPTLFPATQHIHLGGRMHYTLASSILHGDSEVPLISLTLDNIVEGGLIYDPETKQSSSPQHYASDRIPSYTTEEIWPANGPPKQVLPGSMRRLLTSASFQNRCRGLQYLCLQKQGRQSPGQWFPKWHEDDVYDEWAMFIRIVKPKVLVIAHLGGLRRHHYGMDAPYILQPKDKTFRDRLLPVLMEPWEGLERLEVRGVNRRALPTPLEGLKGVDVTVDEKVQPWWNAEARC